MVLPLGRAIFLTIARSAILRDAGEGKDNRNGPGLTLNCVCCRGAGGKNQVRREADQLAGGGSDLVAPARHGVGIVTFEIALRKTPGTR